MNSFKKYIAECIGTFVLVFFACGTAAVTGCVFPEAGYIATALAFGLVIVAMAYSIGNISGCHINPAVSIAMLIRGDLSVKDFFGYIIAQCAGSCLGCVGLMLALGKDCGYGANAIQNIAGTETAITTTCGAFIIEIVLTFVFVLAILGVTSKTENGSVAGLVIGLTLVLVHIIGIPFTGTSVTPARSLFPAIFKGGEALEQVWIFIVAPLCGGALAAFTYKGLSK